MSEKPLHRGPMRESIGCDDENFSSPKESRLRASGVGLKWGPRGWEGVRSYPFGDLAQLYYPDHNYDSALRHFREEMHLTRGMWKAMQAEGYKENTKTLTRAQVRTIVKFLGEP